MQFDSIVNSEIKHVMVNHLNLIKVNGCIEGFDLIFTFQDVTGDAVGRRRRRQPETRVVSAASKLRPDLGKIRKSDQLTLGER
jgi:hypothetical protein